MTNQARAYGIFADALEAIQQPAFLLSSDGEVLMSNRAAAPLRPGENLIMPRNGTARIEVDLLKDLGAGREEVVTGELSIIPVEDSRETAFLALLRDTTDYEAEARHARAALAVRDQFLAALSHELRNPLGAVRAGAELLQHGEPGDRDVGEIARRILSACETSEVLLDHLLELSAIQRHALRIQREEVDLTALLRELTAAYDTRSTATVTLDVPAEPVAINGDRLRLRQVFSNLIDNARKFGGHRVRVALTSSEEAVTVQVVDDGLGIHKDEQQRVFEPFVRIEDHARRTTGGMGIGLTLVRALTKLHGGRASLESEGLGKGSTFTVTLPPAPTSRVRSKAPPPAKPTSTPPIHVLLLDDDEDLRELTLMILRSRGMSTTGCATEEELYTALRDKRPDCMLIDIALGADVSGLDIAQRVKADAATRDIPLIAVSGFGQPTDRQRSLSYGFADHLTKPVTANSLLTAIREVCEDA